MKENMNDEERKREKEQKRSQLTENFMWSG
jgi:hypothetical protein